MKNISVGSLQVTSVIVGDVPTVYVQLVGTRTGIIDSYGGNIVDQPYTATLTGDPAYDALATQFLTDSLARLAALEPKGVTADGMLSDLATLATVTVVK